MVIESYLKKIVLVTNLPTDLNRINFKDNSSNITCTLLLSKFEQDGTKAHCYRGLLGTGKVKDWSAKEISEIYIVESWSVKPPGKRELVHINGRFKSSGDTGIN